MLVLGFSAKENTLIRDKGQDRSIWFWSCGPGVGGGPHSTAADAGSSFSDIILYIYMILL